jgi:hypothetical protein
LAEQISNPDSSRRHTSASVPQTGGWPDGRHQVPVASPEEVAAGLGAQDVPVGAVQNHVPFVACPFLAELPAPGMVAFANPAKLVEASLLQE